MKLKEIILHNFWAKLISLVLAIATWFYIVDLIRSDTFHQGKKEYKDFAEGRSSR
jgi:hypothetical protein